jgi:sugar-specific transcriptional regulator TrmB
MLHRQLQDAGLNEIEAKIYLASLELGQTSASRIAKKAGIKRTTIYLSLENLMQKGLVSAIKKDGKNHYYAEDPRNLERIMEERKQKISSLIPQLLAFTSLIDNKPEIRYFEGEDGIKEVLMNSLEYMGQEVLMMFSESYQADFGDEFFDSQFRPERMKKKISARILAPHNANMLAAADINEKTLRQMRFLPGELFKINIQMVLYGNSKVGIASFKEKFALIIESPAIHDSFKSIFETMWASAK